MGRVLAYVKKGCVPVRVMNLSARPVLIKPHVQLAEAFLVQDVLKWKDDCQRGEQPDDEKQNVGCVESVACQSHDQVFRTNPGEHTIPSCVDLSEAAVEKEEQRVRVSSWWRRMQIFSLNTRWISDTRKQYNMRFP